MERAILLTSGLFQTEHAKTAHGLVRESKRFQIVGLCDHISAGKDAGELLDGRHRDIPVFAGVGEAMQTNPDVCIVGVATAGGVFPPSMLSEVKEAIKNKLNVINGLHDHLNQHDDIRQLAEENGVTLTDLRATKKLKGLHFWTGKIFEIKTPIIAVIGTDCVLGKRTTTRLVVNACNGSGLNAQMIYTGQTGWLQGGKYELGSTVIAIALNTEGLSRNEAFRFQEEYEQLHGIPVLLPLEEGCEKIVPVVRNLVSN
jgi:uncharacterized NAD-dependent epimerase/dehydratase family protein